MDINNLKDKHERELAALTARYSNMIKSMEAQRDSELVKLKERQNRELSSFSAVSKQQKKN